MWNFMKQRAAAAFGALVLGVAAHWPNLGVAQLGLIPPPAGATVTVDSPAQGARVFGPVSVSAAMSRAT